MEIPPPTDATPNRGIFLDFALNAAIPLFLYLLAKRFISHSELNALLIATSFPIAKSVFNLLHRKQLDPVAILILLGILSSIVAIALGGTPRLLLIRESFFTATLGIACLASLVPVFPRPLMFYFGRYFAAQNDPARRAYFDALWQVPPVRAVHRRITLVWGVVFLAEFAVRIVLVYCLSTALVLFLGPLIQGTLILSTIFWTFRYVRNARKKAAPAGPPLSA